MTDFAPTDPYHRFYLVKWIAEVRIVHTTYAVVKPTPAGAWIKEGYYDSEKRWVGHTRKAFAYQDPSKAWHSFAFRMRARFIHAQDELAAVQATLSHLEATSGPRDHIIVLALELREEFFHD